MPVVPLLMKGSKIKSLMFEADSVKRLSKASVFVSDVCRMFFRLYLVEEMSKHISSVYHPFVFSWFQNETYVWLLKPLLERK